MFAKHLPSSACSALEARLEDYLEGRLAPGPASEVQAHVSRCARCAAALERAKVSVDLLAPVVARPLPSAGPLFAGRVMAAIHSERREREQWKPLEIAGWEFCWLAAAAALILAVFIFMQRAVPPLSLEPPAPQNQVQVLINVPMSQPAMQDDTLLVAATNTNGR